MIELLFAVIILNSFSKFFFRGEANILINVMVGKYIFSSLTNKWNKMIKRIEDKLLFSHPLLVIRKFQWNGIVERHLFVENIRTFC